MKKLIFALLVIIVAVDTAQAARKITAHTFCEASSSLMSIFTVIEGTTRRNDGRSNKDKFITTILTIGGTKRGQLLTQDEFDNHLKTK